jgi:hypothetical protein
MTPPASRPSTMDIPTQPTPQLSAEFFLSQFGELRKIIDENYRSNREYMVENFKEFDERLRHIETGEPGCRADIQGQVNGVTARVKTIEDQNLNKRLTDIEPVTGIIKWVGIAVGILIVSGIAAILTHQVTLVFH